MKIIFLDVDGELTYRGYSNAETCNIDPTKIQLLKEICDRTDAKVVISSSWRPYDKYVSRGYQTLRKLLGEAGIDVLGDTPYIKTEYTRTVRCMSLKEIEKIPLEFGTGRGAEIQKWLNEHDVENFVILDDENWDWEAYNFHNHWVQPSWHGTALEREHVEQAIKILNAGNN